VSAADGAAPVSAAEAKTFFAPLAQASALVLAVSGGPDSSALLLLAARWRNSRKKGPKLYAVTIDHGLRPESAAEASAVAGLARRLDIPHRVLRWQGRKPRTGLQEAARQARYRLLAKSAAAVNAGHVLTAHTLDDQAETVLMRMSRGSGISGLCAMTRTAPLPAGKQAGIVLVRPLLEVPKARLVATLRHARIAFTEDPSNRDPRFARARLRQLMPLLAREGIDARRLALLARRLQRVEAALEATVEAAQAALSPAGRCAPNGRIAFDAEQFARLPAEIGLRLLGRAIVHGGDGGPLRLGRLEALYEALGEANVGSGARTRWRRTLAGALVTLSRSKLTIERAPARASAMRKLLTTRRSGARGRVRDR
jgi:tRNA(Ile)-lysidine synthase